MYDCIVVGGGLAGSSAAISALEANPDLEIAIFERGEKHRVKACAGGIAKPMLGRAGIRNPPVQAKIKVVRIHSSGETAELSSRRLGIPYLGLVLDRPKLDWNLLMRAKRLGTEVHLGEGVVGVGRTKEGWFVKTTQGLYQSKYLACCDGALSETAALAGTDTSVGLEDLNICLQHIVRHRARAVEIWFDKSYVKSGYIWVFPMGKLSKVGAGASFAEKGNLRSVLKAFMELRGIGGEIVKTEAAPVPTALPMGKVVHGDLALAGDAARFCCPVTGGGIWSAIISGKLLGRAIGEGEIRRYERYIEPLRADLRRRYFAKRLLSSLSDKDMDRVISALRRFKPRSLSFGKELGRATLYVAIRRPRLIAKVLGKKLEERRGWRRR